ncbi:MAG: thiamine phosphate synthase [Ruminococcus sp.]|nr:thiamine phosphate synthase [Ruminococcus sp.]
MCEIVCVTNRGLCKGDFTAQLTRIAAAKPRAVILREKDLTPEGYKALAEQAVRICAEYGVKCILHSFADIAAELGADSIHLPLHILCGLPDGMKRRFRIIGASCHSVGDALEAQRQGAAYITAGHVFATDCKKGLPPRGLDFLREVCAAVSIPVYAIGGITVGNYGSVLAAGAAGACIMSGLMTADDPREYLQRFRKESDSE